MHGTVRDIRLEPGALSRDATVGQAARAMDANGLPVLPITGPNRELAGVVRAKSLLASLPVSTPSASIAPATEPTPRVMRELAARTNAPIADHIEQSDTHGLDTTIADAHPQLLDAPSGCLLVVDDDGHFAGTLTLQRLYAHLLIPEEPSESLELVCVCGHPANEHHTLALCPCEVEGCDCDGYEAIADIVN